MWNRAYRLSSHNASESQNAARVRPGAAITPIPVTATRRAIMKPSILEKLQQLAERLEEVTHLLGSPEAREAMTAFFEKRRPDFSRF